MLLPIRARLIVGQVTPMAGVGSGTLAEGEPNRRSIPTVIPPMRGAIQSPTVPPPCGMMGLRDLAGKATSSFEGWDMNDRSEREHSH